MSFELMDPRWTVVFAVFLAMASDDALPVLPQCVSLLDSSEDEVVAGCPGAGPGALNSSIPAIFFKPDTECLLSLTQRDVGQVPVVFTGLAESAHDRHEEDSKELQVACSTRNASEPEEEQADFTLVTSSSDEGAIPAAQPRYKLKEMWW